MWTSNAESEAFAKEFAKNVIVAKVAPEELDFFDDLLVEKMDAHDDVEIGFGVAELALLVSPIALFIVKKAFQFIAEDFLKTVGKELGTFSMGKLKEYWTTKDPAKLTLTVEQLKKTAFETGLAKGLDEEKARLMADALIESLAP